ncbi:hypothetical protein M0E82_07800 [Corynebacterium sp. P7202]|uniref:Secreted protein n=1 Tax=Corynebacterium pygosceleis TaxID=2800406 RepID=A0A9Q4CAU3_9CORY|nr:hypothetical protein [Corynebacterium pygosceleis]MCK7637899.1 hypothetical protein [Corynebacterium pygosceleis]MCX7468615.1 hypothetical protein [Corynebacterium pygosceleis]
MSVPSSRRNLLRLLTTATLPLAFVAACSTGDVDTGASRTDTTTVDTSAAAPGDGSGEPGADDSRLILVTGTGNSTETGVVGPDGTVTTLASAPGSVRPAVVRLADGSVAVGDSSGVTVFGPDLRDTAHAEGDATGFITHAVSSPDGRGATFAYSVGDGEHPDRHLIVDVTVDGETSSTFSNSVPVGLTRCDDGHVSWLEAKSPAASFDGGELGVDVAVSRINASASTGPEADVLPAGPAPVWGHAGCGDTVSWVAGDGTAVTVEGGEASRTTIDTPRPAAEGPDVNVGEGTTSDGAVYGISGDGLVESYTFTPEPGFHTTTAGFTGIAGATVTGGGVTRPVGVAWSDGVSAGAPVTATMFDPTDPECAVELGTVVLPGDTTVLAATVRGTVEPSCGR